MHLERLGRRLILPRQGIQHGAHFSDPNQGSLGTRYLQTFQLTACFRIETKNLLAINHIENVGRGDEGAAVYQVTVRKGTMPEHGAVVAIAATSVLSVGISRS